MDLPVFFLDLQTTGATPRNGEILEVAWGSGPKDFHSSLIQQENNYIPYAIQKITGIKEEDLIEALSKDDIGQELQKFFSRPAIIHFASFETPFLKSWLGDPLPFSVFCTHEIAKRLFPQLPTRSLKAMAGFFGYQKEDVKRALSHVEATHIVWQGLIQELAKQEIKTLEDLQNWLALDFKRKKAKFEYPLEKEKRLGLSKTPGVYRMLNRKGEILYIGKATSLHSRVNSYFRGQKNRDPKKLEMLTQVWDLQVTECQSPLEAALLETDEIKKVNPPYNVSLKVYNRQLAFFSQDFLSSSNVQDQGHPVGPFSHALTLESLRNLSASLKDNKFSSHIFFEPFAPELLQAGFQLFCQQHNLKPETFKSIRSILAYGLHLIRKYRQGDPSLTNTLEQIELLENQEAASLDNPEEPNSVPTPLHDPIVNDEAPTAQEMAEKFERHFLRGAAAYLRARALTKLLSAHVVYQAACNQIHELYFLEGKIVSAENYQLRIESVQKFLPWQKLTVTDYDRMSVLLMELTKLKGKNFDDQEA